ncbi:MAG TPA: hypothetical protein DFR83_12770, partial [Deltaproteobacteria bacterium]|nr:hypothetical protein [Deltaproteobacteria bacterium]
AAIEALDAPLSRFEPHALASRITLLDAPILLCDGPSPAPALFRLFLRSRYGIRGPSGRDSLPEDPDLFERALRTLQRLPPEEVAEGARVGLAPGLVDMALERLRRDWWVPAASGLSPRARQFIESWQPTESIPTATGDLVALLERSPKATLFAMTTGGGSLVNDVVAPVQDALFAAMLRDASNHPELLRALCGVVADGAPAGAAVATVLAGLPSPDPETAASIQRARDTLGSPAAPRPLQLPAVPPGRIPGKTALPTPNVSVEAVTLPPSGRATLGIGWLRTLLGLGLTVSALGFALRSGRQLRRWPSLLFGIGLFSLADGLLDVTRFAPPASNHPLFQFIAQSGVELHPKPGAEGHMYTGGGSMRHTTVEVDPPRNQHRVVFLGASSVHGSHYLAEEAFPAMVAALHPQIEAINFGVGGATSAGVAAAGQSALQLKPDALVVMYGHNEVAQFTRLAVYQHTSAHLLRSRLMLSRSAIYRWLHTLVPVEASAAPPGDLYRTLSPQRAEVADLTQLAVRHLRLQIGGLLAEARERTVPVFVVLPPTNLRFAHLEAFDTPGPGDAADLDRLRREAEAAVDSGDSPLATRLLQQAIDRSASPREIVTPIREELIRVAHQHNATVLDAATWMTAHAPDGVTPSGLFWDDVHPTAEGHNALARLVGPALLTHLEPSTHR